jgi:F0F1-type ATP synthase assembly protein I
MALAGLGVQFLAALLVFVYAGNWMDRRFGSSPLFLLSGLIIGGGGVFYASYQRVLRAGAGREPRPSPDTAHSPRSPLSSDD